MDNGLVRAVLLWQRKTHLVLILIVVDLLVVSLIFVFFFFTLVICVNPFLWGLWSLTCNDLKACASYLEVLILIVVDNGLLLS